MSYQSEAELEKQLIAQLCDLGYEKVSIADEEQLVANFRKQLSLHNESKLGGVPLTDKEFERVMRHVEGKSVFQSAKILRDKFVLEREDGSEIYLEFFDCLHWCKNRFQVTAQTTVVGKYTNRYDVTLLINGLPVVQIELKRRGLDMKEAFNQIDRYRKHSYQGLYRYIQIFVISNGVDTKYFANTDKELMYMRPYQIYAVEALVTRALETNNNGFIWHTTGSGKTLTSFKASQILANEPGIKKVFFLVDRKDLDSQTIKEFNKFEPDSVDTTDKTDKLVQQIKDINRPLIVTTIQKMANAVKSPRYEKIMDQYRNEKVIFIIDECHRSQFGDMHKAINKHFHQAQYFGFTGTPRFEENKSQDGRVTADLFEKCLHHYLIKDAINDNNVLGFSVEYINTIRGNYDEMDETKVHAINTDEVFMNETRIEEIARHIIENHDAKTRHREYTAIFTVQSIPMLIKYYDAFKALNHSLKIAGIFTYGANEDSEGRDEHSRDSLERMIADYNQLFHTNYSTDTFSSYFSDVSKRVKNAQIDILLVVNMFLTGFDAKTLNTLYVDKNLKYHDLLQAYSRTNRVQKTKPYGNIVCYRNLKENTDDAIRLFSDTNNTDTVLMRSYSYYLDLFEAELNRLYELVKSPQEVDGLQTEEEKRQFILSFRELSKALVKLETFTEFEFNEETVGISEQTYQDFKSKYFLIYDEVKRAEGEKVSVLADLDFCIEIMHTDKINVSYIMNLIRQIDLTDTKQRDEDIKEIIAELDRADNEELRLKVDLLKSFLNKVIPTLSPEDSIDEAYYAFEEQSRQEEVKYFAEEVNLNEETIQEFVAEYQYAGILNHQEISDAVVDKLLAKKRKVKKVKEFIVDHTNKYN